MYSFKKFNRATHADDQPSASNTAEAIDNVARNPAPETIAEVNNSLPWHSVPDNPIKMATRFDLSYDDHMRTNLQVAGLIPPAIIDYETQNKRCLKQIEGKQTEIDKYTYLSHLRNSNYNLFYRLLLANMKTITPLVYTPVVGEACQKWSHIYAVPEGMYLSWNDRGNLKNVIANWPEKDVHITVVTDGSRILGLGDLGVNGMGIPVGKLALYTGCAGIHPSKTLPITIDLGTDNEENLADELYLGLKMKRLGEAEMMEFLDEMMEALKTRWSGIVIQFEDFKNPFPSLAKYAKMYTCFNDDIQGTGAVILAGVINAVKKTGIAPKDQKLVFMGAGSAGVGVARQIMELFKKEGLTEEEARKLFYLVDSKGLVTNDRGDKLQDHKLIFSRDDNDKQYKDLEEVIDYVKPTVLMGLSTIGGIFTESIVRKMATFNKHPVIFPLSNPSDKSECTYAQAMEWTDDRAIFASGSPFPSYTSPKTGKTHEPGQGNNMYVFPGIGLGTIVSQASLISQEMIYASAESLAASLTPEESAQEWLYPNLDRIRDISVAVARGVIRAAESDGVVRNPEIAGMDNDTLDNYIRSKMYDPHAIPREAKDIHESMWSWITHLTFPWGSKL